ncbi:binding-protein-dependent transport systems inner membrane component [Gracilibacillus boraciitolerans JCM 21714]|uniref:Binding-protein-dependent transport systems inner membrane component n=1 Tax=Gracilibacillus boraciitolerans JCM 21714 TaxID=1298598 RepID=W4VFQ7_9BACI|nr:ABC transporter permease subunit [Gracilibacillus boraciitolerans]GAE91986.1 binding-protein-dependent transport systems inner membrane component [Gracilibacillus boraciitolerans JCM 21714]
MAGQTNALKSTSLTDAEPKGIKGFLKRCKQQQALLWMTVPFVIWVFIFKYLPVWGWSMAFQQYKPALSFTEQEWVGFKHFIFLFTDDRFLGVLRNTLAQSLINLVLGFVTAITLAVLINELSNMKFKRVVQTISYLPHFLSWVVAAALVSSVLSIEGIVNDTLTSLGLIDKEILWLGVGGEYFWGGILGVAETWKNVGWNAIIYLAAISMIDQEQYEAAKIDGASRIQRILHITIPGMKSVIIVLLIMNIGYILEAGFEPQYLLGNGQNVEYSENIDVFVIKYGISMFNFSLATAAGMFKTVISFIFLIAANSLSKKMGQGGLY